MKRLTIIIMIIIVAVVVLAGLLLYFFLFQSSTQDKSTLSETSESLSGTLSLSEKQDNSEANPAVGVTDISEEEITRESTMENVSEEAAAEEFRVNILGMIANTEVVGGTLSANNDRVLYYDFTEEEFVSVNLLGENSVSLSATSFPAVQVVWSPDKTRLIYETPDDGQIFTFLEGSEEIPLGSFVSSPVFTDDSAEIAYYYGDSDNDISTVSLGNPETGLTKYKELASLKGNFVVRMVPTKNKVGYYLSPSLTRQSSLYTTSLDASTTEILLSNKYAFDVKWSPDGSQMVYNKLGQNGRPELWLADGDGRNQRKLTHATYIDKVVWSPQGDYLYLAVPRNLPRIIDYYEGKIKTKDNLYTVNLATGEEYLVYELTKIMELDIRNMFMTPQGLLIYFENYYNHNLMVINVWVPDLDSEHTEPVLEIE
ncbi:TolB family protein [Patescibacteria group bacterium]